MTDKEYIKELEKALIFISECYVKAKDAVGIRESEPNKADAKYTDLWFHFPMIQSTASFVVQKIAELRTPNGNREGNNVSLAEIFDRMHIGRVTETEFKDNIREIVKKHKHD